MNTVYETEVKEKGRTLLPAALRDEADIKVGARLVARLVAPGEILLSTTRAVIREAQTDAPADSGAVEYLLAQRRAEAKREEASLHLEISHSDDAVLAARERVLKALGIEA